MEPIDRLCRICGNKIHSAGVRLDDIVGCTTVKQMLSFCIQMNLHSRNGVPDEVCVKCRDSLLIAYELIVLYHKTSKRWDELRTLGNVDPTLLPTFPDVNSSPKHRQKQENDEATPHRPDTAFLNGTRVSEHVPGANLYTRCCGTCGETFNNSYDLRQHRRLACSMDDCISKRWTGSRPKCCGCHAEFDNPELLRAHSESVHKRQVDVTNDPLGVDGKQFVCNICYRRYTSRSILFDHKQRPYRAKLYQCARCGKAFRDKYSLDDHERAHGDERPFVCGTCSKAFVLKDSYRKHLRLHTFLPDRFKCDVCGKGFRTNGNLKEHRVTHAGTKSLQCSHCPSQFTRKSCLKAHMRLHTGEKPYKCDLCAAIFTFPSDLRRHVMGHNGIKPFPCAMCEKAYLRKDYLSKHMLSSHPQSTGLEPNI